MHYMMNEHWVKVRGSDGKYWVSSAGRVWSSSRQTYVGHTCRRSGRRYICLQWTGRSTRHQVGVVVYESFRGPLGDAQIDHVDRNPANDSLGNLRAATVQFNSWNRNARRGSVSPFKWVLRGYKSRWEARVIRQGTLVFWKQCESQLEAALAADDFAYEHDGDFAALNFPERKRGLK